MPAVRKMLVVAVGLEGLATCLAVHFADHIDGLVELGPFKALRFAVHH
jgi:hypothetical protein